MVRVKLPEASKFDVIVFHYNPIKSPHRISMQVPSEDFTTSDTYSLRLDSADDTKYLLNLPYGETLLEQIQLYGHVAYLPKSQMIRIIEKEEEKNAYFTNGLHDVRASSGRKPYGIERRSRPGFRQVSTLWRSKQKSKNIPH